MNAVTTLLKTDNSVTPLIARLALGIVIFPHGAQKLLGWFGGYGFNGTMGFFTGSLGIPAVFAFLAILAEFAGSIALIFGFLSRASAAGIAAVMGVAALMVHQRHGFFMNWGGNQGGEGYEFHLLALALALIVIVFGGGRASVDQWIAGQMAKR